MGPGPLAPTLDPLRATATASAATALLAAVALIQPARAGTLTGTATIRERIALPPDAVFEAVLIDIARGDAPAEVLGRVRLQPAGQSPFRFAIPYRERDITPYGRYSVSATVRQGERLLLTTDTVHPVLTGAPSQPLNLRLMQVGGGPRPIDPACICRGCSAISPMLVNLEGVITNRSSTESGSPTAHPGGGAGSAKPDACRPCLQRLQPH